MTGTNLIVAAPWIVFGAALGAICGRLYVGRSRARRRRAMRRPWTGPAGPEPAERGRPGAAS